MLAKEASSSHPVAREDDASAEERKYDEFNQAGARAYHVGHFAPRVAPKRATLKI